MEIVVKKFKELTVDELYEVYKLRSDVFVYEQNCVYKDIDEIDKDSIHVLLMDNEELVSYLRVIPKGKYYPEVRIGRVVSKVRRKGYATIVLNKGIDIAKTELIADEIVLEAQVYAVDLYKKVGFEIISDEFLEDGIPHVKMKLAINTK